MSLIKRNTATINLNNVRWHYYSSICGIEVFNGGFSTATILRLRPSSSLHRKDSRKLNILWSFAGIKRRLRRKGVSPPFHSKKRQKFDCRQRRLTRIDLKNAWKWGVGKDVVGNIESAYFCRRRLWRSLKSFFYIYLIIVYVWANYCY